MNPKTLQFEELCVQIIAEKDETRYPELLRQFEEILDENEQGLHEQTLS